MVNWGGVQEAPKLKEVGEKLVSEIKAKYPDVIRKYEAEAVQNKCEPEGLILHINYQLPNKQLGFGWEFDRYLHDHQGSVVNELGGFKDGDSYSLEKGKPEAFERVLGQLIEHQKSKELPRTIEIDGKQYELRNPREFAKDAYADIIKQPWVDENGKIVDEPLV